MDTSHSNGERGIGRAQAVWDSAPEASAPFLEATEVHRCPGSVRAPEWLMQFRPQSAKPRNSDSPFSALCIEGTAAANVRRIEVWVRARSVFAIDSFVDASLRTSSAGEILQAMACMAGQSGMCIASTCFQRGRMPAEALVTLQIRADDPASLQQVRVRIA